MDFALNDVVKRVRNRTTRFRCVFGTRLLWSSKELSKVRLGWKYSRLDFFRFRFNYSYCIYSVDACALTSILLDRYDILYGEHKSDAGVGSWRRRRFRASASIFKLIWMPLLHNV
jgi:hypothetical protein